MAYTTINKPSLYFNSVLYTGNGSTQSITGVNFKPDFVWLKSRSNAYYHGWFDIVRTAGYKLYSNLTNAEDYNSGYLTSFDSNGFSLGSDGGINGSGATFVSWNWLAANSTTTNTSGSITSTVSVNTTSGFSVVGYTGNSSSATVGHGLGVAPKFIIIKHRNDVDDWTCYHVSLGSSQRIQLNNTGVASALSWGGSPTSSVFYLLGGGATAVNVTGGTYIAYCFANVKGFSKFDSYTGNGSTDGTFIYTGFKPAWIMIKRTTTSADSWFIYDNKINTSNVVNKYLTANTSDAEGTFTFLDILSNGFKTRTTDGAINGSGATYIYAAFAENPFVSATAIPTTAR